MEFSEKLQELRKSRSMTQEELAEKLGVSTQMISNLELGKKAIRPENLVKLCNVLNVSADHILRGNRADWEIQGFMEKYIRLSEENQQLLERLTENLLR